MAHTVTHTVEGASNPDLIGRRLVRTSRFPPGNRIELTVLNDDATRPARPSVLVWERVGR